MSSFMTAGRLLVDSQNKKLTAEGVYAPAFRLLADVIQNILDGYYQGESNVLYHEIYVRGNDTMIPIRAHVVGLSLGDGDDTRFFTDRKSIQTCISGVRGNIRVLCHMNGDILGIELSTIERIKKIVALRIVNTEPLQDGKISNESLPKEIAA